ncbi:MAG: PAS domain-containing protein, partial [Chloroflexota bacterium]|nr:PAS domain-containing protein [Chloroflexota bacterium]
MEHEKSILANLSVGIAILSCPDFRVRYMNPCLQAVVKNSWRAHDVTDCLLSEILPEEFQGVALPLVQEACETGHNTDRSDIPYEGFLRERGRTYWRISVKHALASKTSLLHTDDSEEHSFPNEHKTLILMVEDMTELARSRLYLNAIQYVASAIAGPFALPQVLDRILQSVHELVGSTRCAVLLIEPAVMNVEQGISPLEERSYRPFHTSLNTPPTITIAAQQGMHLRAQAWRPQISELLLGRIIENCHTVVITDTSTEPEIKFPLLDDHGIARRPGSVLCVPIFEPTSHHGAGERPPSHEKQDKVPPVGAVIGTIEVYHRRSRGFPDEEVELLEQFAQQAGLAIQHARLFRSMNRLARDASRSARQQKNVLQAIPDGVIIYDPRWRVADANPTVRQLLGWTDEIIGLPMTEALARSSATFDPNSSSLPDITETLDKHSITKHVDEIKLKGADGKNYTMRRSYAPIHDELGDIFASVVIYHDVTEQALARERIEAEVAARTAELAQRNRALQRAQMAQKLASARMELLLERLPSGVVLVSAEDHTIMVINRQAAQVLQRIQPMRSSSDDIDIVVQQFTGKNMLHLIEELTVYDTSGSIIAPQDSPLSLALLKGKATEAEVSLREPDEQPLFLLLNAAPLRDSDGNITSAVLVLHEITKTKTLERAREDFFTTMAHELKTPLANIRAHLSALQASDYQWSASEQQDFIETADEQVER